MSHLQITRSSLEESRGYIERAKFNGQITIDHRDNYWILETVLNTETEDGFVTIPFTEELSSILSMMEVEFKITE